MGGPELPTDPGDEHHFPTPVIEHPRIGEQSEDSDDSDAYDGYQPLATDAEDAGANAVERENGPDRDVVEHNDADIDLMTAEVTHGDPNMPPIESADAEIERQVWNEPRPKELQLELDKTRTEQVSHVECAVYQERFVLTLVLSFRYSKPCQRLLCRM